MEPSLGNGLSVNLCGLEASYSSYSDSLSLSPSLLCPKEITLNLAMQKATLIGTIVAVIVCCVSLSSAYQGQDIYAEPNCGIVSDHSRMFRDINDPTHYWVCPEGKDKADYIQCPDNYAFMEKEQRCVVWEEWHWVEPYTK